MLSGQALITTVANLAIQDKEGIASPAIQNAVDRLYEYNKTMIGLSRKPITGLAVPYTEFLMANYEGARFHNVDMENVDFVCIDLEVDEIEEKKENDSLVSFCTQLKDDVFNIASLRQSRFEFADPRNVKFSSTFLTEATINGSDLSDAEFLEDVDLRGIRISRSNLSGTMFGSKAKFRCTVNSEKCPELDHVDLSKANMEDVLFRGAELEHVDFTGTNLKETTFDCKTNGQCTILENICFQDTDLSRAEFEGVTITNSNFTGADLEKAKFENVVFKGGIVFSEEQEMEARFSDEESRDGLHQARVDKLDLEDEIPCSEEWRKDFGFIPVNPVGIIDLAIMVRVGGSIPLDHR
ncbi:MAG: pentapeptide repeat-containing protein [Rhodobacteraceae bacterium]|nr:pentapeptide repeat-containing protein [Paracoccaceae bacterium]